MNAEIISIGTELLLGQIVDTDAAYLSQQLSALGIAVYHRATVGDNLERAVATVAQAWGRADLVFLIGGLGPTMDDLTRDVIATVAGAPLIRDENIADGLRDYVQKRNGVLVDTLLRQADVPTGARALPNAWGTAPGLLLQQGPKAMISLPGPPNEFVPLFEAEVYPFLREITSGTRQVIRSRSLRITGMGESLIEERVRDLMQDANPTVAPYAKTAEVHLRVTARAPNEADADALIAARVQAIYDRLGTAIYGEDTTTLEAAVVALLRQHRLTVALAESCTGGLLGGRITSVSGASEVFGLGVVSYSNQSKVDVLKIPQALVSQMGAVSPEVACAMAERVKELAPADFGLSITGIAGPNGGTPEKPVGLVYIGLASATGAVTSTRYLFGGSRDDIRARATQMALHTLRQALIGAA